MSYSVTLANCRAKLTFILKKMELHSQQADRLAKRVGRGAFLLGAKLENLLKTREKGSAYFTSKSKKLEESVQPKSQRQSTIEGKGTG